MILKCTGENLAWAIWSGLIVKLWLAEHHSNCTVWSGPYTVEKKNIVHADVAVLSTVQSDFIMSAECRVVH